MISRNTSQRRLIENILSSSPCPLSIQEILNKGRQGIPSLNLTTVYRHIRLLAEKGWIKSISHPSLGTLYETRDKAHHHHFHCYKCDRIYELKGCPLKKSGVSPPGFILENHEVYLSGLCANCNNTYKMENLIPVM